MSSENVNSRRLWEPSAEQVAQAEITRFRLWVNARFSLSLNNYDDLWAWSVERLELFWAAIAEYFGALQADSYSTVLEPKEMPGARWFPGQSCNFAEFLLEQGRRDGDTAIIFEAELGRNGSLTWGELRAQVSALASKLRALGVKPGDRVVGYLTTCPEAVISLLATVSIGAIWSCCSPDFGAQSVLDRFGQLKPSLLITQCEYQYAGRKFNRKADVLRIIEEIKTLEHVIHVHNCANAIPDRRWLRWDQMIVVPANNGKAVPFVCERVDFNHPLWVLYTSGTTGPPKGVVHGHGGILLEFLKSTFLHQGLTRCSVKMFYTTTGWTMFNLLLGSLVAGATIVLYDGSPLQPDIERLWQIAERRGVTHFGASPGYFSVLSKRGVVPREHYDLRKITSITLTGSAAESDIFRWIYRNVSSDIQVISSSGGTDVASAFVGSAPILPVLAGRIQAPCLGVAAYAFDEKGERVVDKDGELVITRPMPSMPLFLWNDINFANYEAAYFRPYPGIWRQGDTICFAPDMSSVIAGRSDATLNRGGVRIGTAEIYRVVSEVAGVLDYLVVDVNLRNHVSIMALFIVLERGRDLDEGIQRQIKRRLNDACSPRHVPDEIISIPEIPYTLSGKRLEVPVKKLLMGQSMTAAVNLGAVRNPQSLQAFAEHAKRYEKLSDASQES
jgi:acetoacetyl-CoA synthetase